jgi:hypothetical protein
VPTTIAEAFAAATLGREGVVRWGTKPTTYGPGVYIVSLTESLDSCVGKLTEAPLSPLEFQCWLDRRRELTLDGTRPTVQQLTDRIRRFWIPDESVLYIGLAGTSLSTRLGQYYATLIGDRSPHAGGYFLKLLSNLSQLWVHYAECSSVKAAENRMLRRFCEHVSDDSKRVLQDPAHPFPFANLEWPAGTRKAHGLRGACETKRKISNAGSTGSVVAPVLAQAKQQGHKTQRVTAVDLRCGRIRIPSARGSQTKSLFPSEKGTIHILLAGRLVSGSWDPRMGPDRERSGVLHVGSLLRELVREGDVLLASTGEGGTIRILTGAGCSVSR